MIKSVAGLDLPLSQDERLQRILASALGGGLEPNYCPILPWDAAYFGLDRVTYFQQASIEQQRQILQITNRQLLEEAYFVEKAGMGYMAKMVLLAETVEERMLYALFSADEAIHLSQIRGFLASEPENTTDPFFQLLAELAAIDDRAVLMFVIQVVLEGWGLSHYRSLAQDCQIPALAVLFTGFLQEESKHHATGVTLFQSVECTVSHQAAMLEVLAKFLQMVQVGPQGVVGAIGQVLGGLSVDQRVKVFDELDTQTHSGTRLTLLQKLMQTGGGGVVVDRLIEKGAFEPLPASICATL
jgi:hypothetical protein